MPKSSRSRRAQRQRVHQPLSREDVLRMHRGWRIHGHATYECSDSHGNVLLKDIHVGPYRWDHSWINGKFSQEIALPFRTQVAFEADVINKHGKDVLTDLTVARE